MRLYEIGLDVDLLGMVLTEFGGRNGMVRFRIHDQETFVAEGGGLDDISIILVELRCDVQRHSALVDLGFSDGDTITLHAQLEREEETYIASRTSDLLVHSASAI